MQSLPQPRTAAVALAAVLALGALAACGSDSDTSSSATASGSGAIEVTEVWARESAMSSGNGAVYFTVTNGGDTDDELLSASVSHDVAAMAQVHETVEAGTDSMDGDMSDDTTEGDMAGEMSDTTMAATGMMTMQEVESVTVPAGGSVSFAPGGYHVMLMELVEPLEVGASFPVTLTFAEAGEVTVTAAVRAS